jgi:1,4-alpha-glucan branching enzyme
VHNLGKELNRVYRDNPALWALDSDPAGFEWLNADDNAWNTYSYLRFGTQDRQGAVVAVAVNFGGLARDPLRIGVPRGGDWKVILDTSGYDEFGTPSQAEVVLTAQEHGADGQPWSVEVRVAALSAVYLAPVPDHGRVGDGHAEDGREAARHEADRREAGRIDGGTHEEGTAR